MVTDTVSDALVRIKNGYMANRVEIKLPYSKLVVAICDLLKREGYIGEFKEVKRDEKSNVLQLSVTLKYDRKRPAVSDVKRVSKPGLRVYKGKHNLPYVLNGLGIAIISTPKGVMTDKQARREGVGGEILAHVW